MRKKQDGQSTTPESILFIALNHFAVRLWR